MSLPSNASERKDVPLTTGVLDYFPDALAEVARVSKAGNEQHNPGQPLHWAREKSTDHADCIGRHLLERGTMDVDGQRHSAKLAWRALANLQVELEAEEELVDPVSDPPGRVQRVRDYAAEEVGGVTVRQRWGDGDDKAGMSHFRNDRCSPQCYTDEEWARLNADGSDIVDTSNGQTPLT